jgi:ABC-2 type transport system permease protein
VRRVLAIAFKDVRRTYRTPSALLTMLAAPLILASLLGAAFGGAQAFSIQPVKVVVVNNDAGFATTGGQTDGQAAGQSGAHEALGTILVDVLRSSGLEDVLEVTAAKDAATARNAVDDGDAAVAVIMPKDLSASLSSGSRKATIELYSDPKEEIGPPLVAGIVGQVAQGFEGSRATVAAVAQWADRRGIAAPMSASELGALTQRATADYEQLAQTSALRLDQRAPRVPGASGREPSVASMVLAGMMVFFMFIGASTVTRTIVEEEIDGTLPRLFTTPTRRSAVLGGKFTSAFLTVLLQTVILLLAGVLLFQAYWGGPTEAVALALAGAAVASSLALLLTSFARTVAQAGAMPSGVYLVLALLGGNFVFGLADEGIYAVVQRLTPNGWLLIGWNHAMSGDGFSAIVVPLLMVLAFAVLFFVLAALRFRRRYA